MQRNSRFGFSWPFGPPAATPLGPPAATFIAILVFHGCFAAHASADDPAVKLPTFRPQTIDKEVGIGYGTAIGDVDGDGRPDILLADAKQFVWYQNPSWKKHLIAENLTARDNVCIAARDIDGDGKVEIAVGGQWNPGDTLHSGAVFYLDPPQDRRQKWTPIQLKNEPVIHRMRWLKLAEKRFALIVSPLHGRGNRGGKGAGVKLMAYYKPANPRDEWRREVIEDTMHQTHNLDVAQWNPTTPAEEVLYLGREGAMLLSYSAGKWSKARFERVSGGGEIRMGLHSKTAPFIVTIEPMHGDKLVYYASSYDRSAGSDPTALSGRTLLDDSFQQGHAIAAADLLGRGDQQIVAGWRAPNREKIVGVKMYFRPWPLGPSAARPKTGQWDSLWIDKNGMATEDIRIGDLNGDGRPDIVAAGRSTHNLKVYWKE